MTYIPTAAGMVTLPAVNLAWWNTQTNTPSVATLPALQLDAVAATGAARANAAGATSASAPPTATASAAASGTGSRPLAPSIGDRLAAHWRAVAAGASLLALVAAGP